MFNLLMSIFGSPQQTPSASEEVENRSQDVHALEIDLVWSNLIKYIKPDDLKNIRLVNKYWNSVVISEFHKMHIPIPIGLKLQEGKRFCGTFEELLSIVKNTLIFPLKKIDLYDLGRLEFQFLSNYGNHITQLSILYYELTPDQLARILARCTNLEYLVVPVVSFYTGDSQKIPLPGNPMRKMKSLYFREELLFPSKSKLNQERLNNFLLLFPNLEALGFFCPEVFVVPTFLTLKLSPSPLGSLQKLEFHDCITEEIIKRLICWSNNGLVLTTLKLAIVEIGQDRGILTNLLALQAKYLQELWVKNISMHPDGNGHSLAIFFMPFSFPRMPQLKTLCTPGGIVHSLGGPLRNYKNICIPTLFPALTSLRVSEDAFSSQIKSSKPSTTVTHLTIVTISTEIDEISSSLAREFWKIQDMFPNVKKLTLDSAVSFWLSSGVFKHLQNLRELCIENGRLKSLDLVMTGIRSQICEIFLNDIKIQNLSAPIDFVIQTYLNNYRNIPSICDLKSLKVLRISQYGWSEFFMEDTMTDAAGYLALLQMQPLDVLQLSQGIVSFSKGCLEALKKYHQHVFIY